MQPFNDIRVLDLTHVFAGPFAAYQLGVLGAEVIKIEPPDAPDMMRVEGDDPDLNAAGMGLGFQAQGGGKRTLALDLKSDAGRALFDRLVVTADVVVQNYTAPAATRLGLDYGRLAALKPDLIYCAISGFGQTGPKRDQPAYDNVIQAYAGVMASNGRPGEPPLKIGPAVIDYGTGVQAALAISAALYGRATTGLGRRIDVAMADAALMLMTSHTVTALATGAGPQPHGNGDRINAGYGCYHTADGLLMIGAYTNRQIAALMRVLGNDAAANEVQHAPRDRLSDRWAGDAAFVAEAMLTRGAAEWETLLNAHDIPAARVRSLAEALGEPQFATRGVVQDDGAGRSFPVAGFTYDRGAPQLAHPARAHGADSRAILAEVGVEGAEFDRLAANGVVCDGARSATPSQTPAIMGQTLPLRTV